MLYELWQAVVARQRGEIALRDASSGQRWTFEELFAAGEKASTASRRLAFPQGNTPAFIIALLAAWREGKIICPLEFGQPEPHVPLPPNGCVHLKTTSATTGTARFVVFNANQLAADARNIVATMGLRPEWPNLGVVSIAHSYGFSNLALPLLLHGIPLIICSSPLPEPVRRAAEGEAAVTLPAVPAMWRGWHEASSIPPNVRLAISAGAPLPIALEQAVHNAIGLKIHNFYGSSECGGIAYDTTNAPRADDTFVGSPMKNVELSTTAEGCLIVRGEAVGEGYWPEAAETLGNSTFQTSDVVELSEGKVFLRGRLSDLINVAGRKVAPLTIERELSNHPAVNGCIVFGVPDRDGDRADLIVAGVVARTNVTTEELRRFLLERLPAWQIPRDWVFAESLTSNRLGKVSRAEWRQRYLQTH